MRIKYIVLALFSISFSLKTQTIALAVPGTVIHHVPASSRIYIGSPGIVAIDEGVYLAKHDEFGPDSTEWVSAVTRVYRSDDAGKSWKRVSMIDGLFWSSMFTHNDDVYLLGTDKHHGNTVIMRSEDEGKTWTEPLDGNSGLLLQGQYHTAPVPVLIHNGRIWRAMEDATGTMSERGGPWGGPKYGSFMMSAAVDSDLLKSDSWTVSNVVQRQDQWLDGQTRAWLEGNAVVTPEGSVACVLRVNFQRDPIAQGGIASVVQISQDGTEAVFNPDEDFIQFPGGSKKFTIRYDEKSRKYWTLTNYVPSHHQGQVHACGTRNTVALASSTDLRNWKIEDIVLYHPDIRRHGFQYIDWQFEGDDIIAASRTAYDDGLGGARSAHDANYLTFHRIENFRTLPDLDYHKAFVELSRDLDAWHISKPDYKEPDAHMVARWCFESTESPLADTAIAGSSADNLSQTGRVDFADGIAKFPAGQDGTGLKAAPGSDISASTELTVWMRFRLEDQPDAKLWLIDKGTLTQDDKSYGIYIMPDAERDYQFRPGAVLSQDGTELMEILPVDIDANPPVGLWVQLALVVETQGPFLTGRLYFRTEHTSRPNPWVLLGQSKPLRSIFESGSSIVIGNNSEFSALSSAIALDEIKIYDRALSIDELYNCWSVFGSYPELPSEVPGIVIDHSPASTQIYLGSPSIVVLPDGTYVAKADEYGRGAEGAVTRLYHSYDKGRSWERIAKIEDMFWSNLFYHNEALYLMGTSYGHGRGYCVVRRSYDAGRSWTAAEDENTGILFEDKPYHTAPMPVVIHNGRIWRSMEDEQGEPRQFWGTRFRAFMMSADIDSDLLKASSWSSSQRLGYNPDWLDGRFRGWTEGNAVVDPQGKIVNMLRVDNRPDGGKAAIITYDVDGNNASFNPDTDFIDFPGGNKKFFILYDEPSGLYWAMSNAILPRHAGGNLERAREYVRQSVRPVPNPGGKHAFANPERLRNTLVLMASEDLRQWQITDVVLYHPEVSKHGFQYPHFVFEGDDILLVSRTAYDDGQGGADNQHNANFLTFHRIRNFRRLAKN